MRPNLQFRRPNRDSGPARRAQRCKPNLELLENRQLLSGGHDVLEIGDNSDNSIKQFDAKTGAYLGTLVAPGSGGLAGPRGLIDRNNGQLLVANQNVNLPTNGEIDRYDAKTGAVLYPLFRASDPNAPFAPRGMVVDDKYETKHGDAPGMRTSAGQVRVNPQVSILDPLSIRPHIDQALGFRHHVGNLQVNVMTNNINEGTEFIPLSNPAVYGGLRGAVSATWRQVQSSNIPARAEAMAKEIARNHPDVVGLQEVAVYTFAALAGQEPTVTDSLALLLHDLRALGQQYTAVAVSPTATFPPLPDSGGDMITFKEENVIIARTDLSKDRFKVSNPQT